MKKIEAIIQPNKLEAVKEALAKVDVTRLTVTDVYGFGKQKGLSKIAEGLDYEISLLKKVRLEIAVNDEFVDATVDTIVKNAKTDEKGSLGDGKIFILPLDECVRIRTGEHGSQAI